MLEEEPLRCNQKIKGQITIESSATLSLAQACAKQKKPSRLRGLFGGKGYLPLEIIHMDNN